MDDVLEIASRTQRDDEVFERSREARTSPQPRNAGDEAARLGLALEAVPAAEVVPRAMNLAQAIARNAPLAVAGVKRGLGVDPIALDRALAHEAREQAISYASAELGAGLLAVNERRKPGFTGR